MDVDLADPPEGTESIALTLDEIRAAWVVLRFAEGELRSRTESAASMQQLPLIGATLQKLEAAWETRTNRSFQLVD